MAANSSCSNSESQQTLKPVLIRVKRKLADVSDESTLLGQPASKHSKNHPLTDKSNPLLLSDHGQHEHQLFHFIGTVKSMEDQLVKTQVTQQLRNNQEKRSFSKLPKVDVGTIKAKIKNEQHLHRKKQRFKVISHRIAKMMEVAGQPIEHTVSNDKEVDQASANCEIVDVEELPDESEESSRTILSGITCNGMQMTMQPSPDQYTYDLYWCQNTGNSLTETNGDLAGLGETIEFESFDERLLVSSNWQRQMEYNERYDDEDDPNDEDNWRNDYPDEDDINSWNESSDDKTNSYGSGDDYCNISSCEDEGYGYFEERLRLSDYE